ncbi:hypothetical protein PQJ75_13490 [Rhodoplanes sp. TEM]|uniref:SAM-dependent methyltransferase n=1 Tax=Rhodoplanes tepidamans TaxID=200616 RepID=A0ABT5JCF5_RHOTP|nr:MULTISPECIES: hypothetical protein [Rhodoplanes]MDC7787375.1 hypothetical protein [Rhodoplanes tepidamans]MDC7984743.1 hypothetical protein [Rhodoplanes sp. TEM]MDQ0358286.1 hypothetical protein [Rhodoplanes tepidamans]
MSATFGGGWDAQLALPWDELILRWIEAAERYDDTWGTFHRIVSGT